MGRFYCRMYGCTVKSDAPEAHCLKRQFALLSPGVRQYPYCANLCKQGMDIRRSRPALAAEIEEASSQICRDKQFKRRLLSLNCGLAAGNQEAEQEEVEEYA